MTIITSSAIKYNGVVHVGKRHADILRYIAECGHYKKDQKVKLDMQGFITSDGIFVDRETGKVLAMQSGQISEDFEGTLHSEDLWK